MTVELPVEEGHFLLESGLHTDYWVNLDAMFVDLQKINPYVTDLANKINRFNVTAVCGPLTGGAFLAQHMADRLGLQFFTTRRVADLDEQSAFSARYELLSGQKSLARGQTFAVVDDAISAGSSVRATIAALEESGAQVKVVGALIVFGSVGADYFERIGKAVVAIERRKINLWKSGECPLCKNGMALERRLG